jgi:hypothetical protein
MNVADPVALPPNCPATVAINVRDSPEFDGFSDETRVVVVLARFTTWLSTGDLLGGNEVLPL